MDQRQDSPKIFEGLLNAQGMKLALVASRFNELIVQKLVGGAIDCFVRHGGAKSDLTIAWVPGAFEIPLLAKKFAQTQRFDAIVCLGAVIRGSTPHFEYVSSEVTKGIAQVSLEFQLPVSFGVLTTDNIEQAIERSGTKAGNKGWDATLGAIEMFHLLQQIPPN